MKKIGIVVPMDEEFKLVKEIMGDAESYTYSGSEFIKGTINDKTVIISHSGIGKVCAAVGIMEMIKNFAPDCIINTGVAGGIDESLKVADIVIGEKTVYHDVWCGEEYEYGQMINMPTYFESDKDLYKKAMSVKTDSNIVGGLICTGDKFITDGEVLMDIKKHFPDGLAVEMESCAMAQVCYMYKVPFLSFRIISDTPGNHENNEEQFKEFFRIAPKKTFKVLKEFIKIL